MVSVILPVYNRGKYIKRCLDSLLNQTYSDYEVIIVDDGSTDETPGICDEYQRSNKKIKVIHSQNKGPAAARNLGMDAAQGDLIMFSDSDDTAEPQWIQKLSECMSNPQVLIAASSYYNRSNQNPAIKNVAIKEKETFLDAKDFLFIYRKYQIRTLWHCCFRKTQCRFHEDLTLGEDGIFVMEYILEKSKPGSGKMHFIEDCLYNYHAGTPNSLCKQKLKSKQNIIEYKKLIYSRFMEKFSYTQDQLDKLNSNLRRDRLPIEFDEAIRQKKYRHLKELFSMPEYDDFIKKNFQESGYRRILLRKRVFLVRLYHEIYLPIKKR